MHVRTTAAAALALLLAGCGREHLFSRPLFSLHSPRETGIHFENTLAEDDSAFNALHFDYMYNGGGVAVGDVNGDGKPDLFFTGNMVSSRLYLNRGNFHFEDVTDASGVGTKAWATGVTMVDINQDGRLDIYVSVAGPVPGPQRANLLFVNQGNDANGIPHFVERAKQYGIADTGYSTQAVFFDYDHDGDLDLFVLENSLEETNRNLVRPKITNGMAPSVDHLYRNNGDGTFTDVSKQAGITAEGYGLGVAVSDLNGDGWPDIYVANDFVSNDVIWINNRDGTFTNRAAQYLKHQTYNAMGVDVADYDNDGRPDIAVVDMLPPGNQREKMMLQGASDEEHLRMMRDLGYEPEVTRNTLQLNDGIGPDGQPHFSEIGELAGIAATDWSWAPLFADFDNDGRKDLFISNGYRRDVTNLDYIQYIQDAGKAGPDAERRKRLLEALRVLPTVKLSSYLFHNEGDLTFGDSSRAWGLDQRGYANGAAYVDLDGDGDLDLVVNQIDGPVLVYENHAERLPNHHWLGVALKGQAPNVGAYGAKVTIHTGATAQYLEMQPTRGYVSSVDPTLHFGLGAVTRVDSLRVEWPDGRCTELLHVAADRVVPVDQRGSTPCPPRAPPSDTKIFQRAAGDAGLQLKHDARDVPDFELTPLLPHALSRGGPALAVGDVDGDGREDVYVGADRGHEKAIWLQTSPGHFTKRVIPGAEQFQDMGALLLDVDGDGDLDLVVASGGSTLGGDQSSYRSRLYINDGHGNFTEAMGALPGVVTSASSVVAADYDGDGDLDLFIAGYLSPGKYPLPPRSFLLRNDTPRGGAPHFTDVTDSVAPGLANVGMVTSALFTDADGDGRVDLLLAGEWMPITLFHNTGARFENATAAAGLGATSGWWNSLVAADVDGDGDMDYVVGNLGLNTRWRASAKEPVEVFAADFDGNGGVDPILTHYVDGTRYPAASRDQLLEEIPGMRNRFPTYAKYADATLEKTLTRDERAQAYVARANTFASAWLENTGGGKFVVHALPTRAQFAPIYGMIADDFDGDGNVDVLLAGNSSAEEARTGSADASIGALLLGDGHGGWRFENGAASGFFVDGDAKAAAQLVLDPRHAAVLVTQHDDSLRVFMPTRMTGSRWVKLDPLDARAEITLANGRVMKKELYYGSTYLSQSSRWLEVPAGARKVVVYDSRGRGRELSLGSEP